MLLIGLLVPVAACSGDVGIGFTAPTIVYDQVVDAGITIPAVYSNTQMTPDGLNPQFARRQVETPGHIAAPPGTIVVDTPNRYLYLVEANGKSMRYGIGVGREGFAWAGEATIKAKQAWPTWTPPPEMLARDPSARQFAKGMPGGLDNPLGARAMYLYQGDRDTLYRIHGTTEAWSIGMAVSSGCVRMLDQDVIDLYRRVSIGTKVIVMGDPTLIRAATSPAVVGSTPSGPPSGEALFPPTPPPALPPADVGPA
jgi:lipoprotein-anchoring transpeptidase ErfK/SrfK